MFNENHVVRTTLILTVFLGLASLFYRPDVGFGFLCGGLISVLALRLMIIDSSKLLQVSKQGHIGKRGAMSYTLKGFVKRCTLYSLALAIAATSPYMNFLSTLAGLLLPRVAIFYHQLRGRTKRAT